MLRETPPSLLRGARRIALALVSLVTATTASPHHGKQFIYLEPDGEAFSAML